MVSQREYAGTGTKSETLKSSTDFTYASKTNYLTGVKHYSPLGTQSITYTYGSLANGQMPDQVYSVKWNGTEKVKYTYDAFGRLTNKKVGTFNNTYTYHNYGTARTTTLGMSVTTPAGKYAYTYDKSDKVVSYTDGTHKTTYAYDDLNQLVRENNPKTGKTYTYSYKNGNITQRNEYAYTTGELGTVTATKKWTYGDTVWKDLLTNFNGEAVTYDTIGNPTKIGSKTLTWNGRQLAKYVNGSNTTSYAYNGDGQRISKTVNGTKTDYYYNGSILAGQKTGSNTLVFMYDNNGDAFGFKYNGTEYFYVKNLQNDITAITDSAGKVIANYYYDAWGNITSTTGNTTIANANPLRYRSYYYDTDTKLYYLNTRYYSPDMSRFLNADGQLSNDFLGNNLFAYCGNSPVSRADTDGKGWWVVAGAFVGAIVGGGAKIISNIMAGTKWYAGAAGAAIGGGVAGAVLAATCNTTAAAFAGAASESLFNQVVSYIPKACYLVGQENPIELNKRNALVSVGTVAVETAVYGATAKVAGKIAGKIIPTNSGWFKPKKFVSSFVGKYAKKAHSQTLVQGIFVSEADTIKQLVEKIVDTLLDDSQEPIVNLYPESGSN